MLSPAALSFIGQFRPQESVPVLMCDTSEEEMFCRARRHTISNLGSISCAFTGMWVSGEKKPYSTLLRIMWGPNLQAIPDFMKL